MFFTTIIKETAALVKYLCICMLDTHAVIGCRNIIRRIELIRYVNILQHLSNHRGFSYLTGANNHLNKLSALYKSILNRLIFSSFIHTQTFYSVR